MPTTASKPPFIVCFDSASTVGVCDGLVGGAPRHWTWKLAGNDRPHRLLALSKQLGAYYSTCKVDHAFVEAPLPLAVMMEIGATDDTVQMLRSVVAIIETMSAKHGIPCAWWRVQEARKAVTGRATFPKGTAKAEVIKYCRMLGHQPQNDNEADALVGWLFESARLNPRLAALYSPLFGAAHAR